MLHDIQLITLFELQRKKEKKNCVYTNVGEKRLNIRTRVSLSGFFFFSKKKKMFSSSLLETKSNTSESKAEYVIYQLNGHTKYEWFQCRSRISALNRYNDSSRILVSI